MTGVLGWGLVGSCARWECTDDQKSKEPTYRWIRPFTLFKLLDQPQRMIISRTVHICTRGVSIKVERREEGFHFSRMPAWFHQYRRASGCEHHEDLCSV